jgi:hypothetical protein
VSKGCIRICEARKQEAQASPAQGHSLSAGIERVLPVLPADVLLHPVSEGWERGEGPVKQVLLCFVHSGVLQGTSRGNRCTLKWEAKVNYHTSKKNLPQTLKEQVVQMM